AVARGHHEEAAVARRGGEQRERAAGVARRRPDDRAAGAEEPPPLGVFDHREPDPVLDAAARVEPLELGEDPRGAGAEARQLDERRRSDRGGERRGSGFRKGLDRHERVLKTITKKPRRRRGSKSRRAFLVGLLRPASRVALAAVDRLAVGRVERHLCLLATGVARHVVERPLATLTRGRLALVAAGLAALGLVGEALARVELLVVGRKQERAATVDASEVLVRVLLHHGTDQSPGFYPPGALTGTLGSKKRNIGTRTELLPAPRAGRTHY